MRKCCMEWIVDGGVREEDFVDHCPQCGRAIPLSIKFRVAFYDRWGDCIGGTLLLGAYISESGQSLMLGDNVLMFPEGTAKFKFYDNQGKLLVVSDPFNSGGTTLGKVDG
jgi:hypothetical protein